MAEAPSTLTVQGLSKTYGTLVAVSGVSFDLNPGDILALVGPNGAGKTTTMRAVCGIISPTAGAITIAGHSLKDDPIAAKAALAYVPDDPKLFDALTVWEHLQFIAAAYNVADWQPAAEALLEAFDLVPKRTALAMELSRGMRQKVAIACAYLHNPALILLDEPLTGLDPVGIRTMKDSIRARAEAGAAVVLSSHLLGLVQDLCTRVLIMKGGVLRFAGTIAEARDRFAAGAAGASLEEVFFSATSGDVSGTESTPEAKP
ncbi:MAG: ABC transporter ATP-binding protein [Phycisphaeraceae bacterium]|nr:ABC transporter ATP-binding protein [Phycisphaeraceae bacterium]